MPTAHRVECDQCGKRFADIIKLGQHGRKSHPGKTVGAIIHPKQEKEAS
jgi:hypothetical protein